MSPRSVLRAFHPASMPYMSRGHYRRELGAWLFLSILVGAIEGGVVSVIAKVGFEGTVSPGLLNLAVAVLTSAPAFANVTSFLWTGLSHGRDKVRFLVTLQLLACLLVMQVAFAPRSGVGLAMLCVAAIGARMCWAGVVTLRSTVWRQNYPRNARATLAGRLGTVQAIMLGATGLGLGLALRQDDGLLGVLYPLTAGCGVVGALLYGRMRVRGHRALLAAERAEDRPRGAALSPMGIGRVLGEDARFRRYMGAMFVFGIGNLAVAAPLVIILREVFGLGYLGGIVITTVVPTTVMVPALPFWSRFLDRTHIARFRTVHCWAFVAANLAYLVGALLGVLPLVVLGAVFKGIAFGGGILGWNLGHHDYAPPDRTSEYMSVHVTLTGVRGLIGPALSVAGYQLLEGVRPGTGPWVIGVCLALNLVGARAFYRLAREVRGERLRD